MLSVYSWSRCSSILAGAAIDGYIKPCWSIRVDITSAIGTLIASEYFPRGGHPGNQPGLVQVPLSTLGHKDSRFKRLFDVGILRDLAELLKYLGAALCALPQVAEHHDEEFFGIFYSHVSYSFVVWFSELPAPPDL